MKSIICDFGQQRFVQRSDAMSFIYPTQSMSRRLSILCSLAFFFFLFPIVCFLILSFFEIYFTQQSTRTVFAIWWHMATYAVMTRPI